MKTTTRVTVENGSMKKELGCDLFVGMMISEESAGHNCEQLIAGVTGPEGIFSAIRMLRQLENHLYEALPIPRELAELKLAMEESLQKAMGKKCDDDDRNSRKSDDPFLSAIKLMLGVQNEDDNPLKKLFDGLDLSEFGDRGNGN